MRAATRAIGLVLVLGMPAACAAGPTSGPGGRVGSDAVVYLRQAQGMSAVKADTGNVLFTTGPALAGQSWSELVTIDTRAGEAELVRLDARSGEPLSRIGLPSGLDVRLVSGSGRMVALTPGRADYDLHRPEPRARTTIAVTSIDGTDGLRHYRLRGNYEPEAFSYDDRWLFLIQYLPAIDPNRYAVRLLHLDSGRVTGLGRLKQAAPAEMRGTGRRQSMAPDGTRLYTLYTRQPPNDAHGTPSLHSGRHPVYAFIHVLTLTGGTAHCIDLPAPFGSGRPEWNAIAVSPDGTRLVAAEWTSGTVAVLDSSSFRVLGTKQLELASPGSNRPVAGVGDDGTIYLGAGREVVALDGESLEVIRRVRLSNEISSLDVEEGLLFVGQRDEVVLIDPLTGTPVDRFAVPGLESIAHVKD
ncbi:MAG: YncE family protein [Actinomycetota bacterium]